MVNHPGTLNYQGELTDNSAQLVSPAFEGMFYIINLEGQPVTSVEVNSLTLHHSDWLIYLRGNWVKLTNSSPVTNLNFGVQSVQNPGEYTSIPGDLTYEQVKDLQTDSVLSDFYNVEGTPAENNVIQWDGTKWIYAVDNQGADEIDGNSLPNNLNLYVRPFKYSRRCSK